MRNVLDVGWDLSTFSSIVFLLPSSKELAKRAEALRACGLLTRERKLDEQAGTERWAYRRTEAGSKRIGATP